MSRAFDIAELVAFVHASLDEDAAVALAVGEPRRWHAYANRITDGIRYPQTVESIGVPLLMAETYHGDKEHPLAVADHIARWSTKRVLDGVEAARRIVDWCVEVIGARDLSTYGEFGALRDDPQALAVTLAVETLRNLAAPYEHRPGYRKEWKT